jgi:hypothetical protein
VTRAGLVALAALMLGGCFGPREILARGQAYYENNEYERALAVWRELERHESVLSSAERARYAYLRGMTDYRLGFRDDARHWLAMAKVTEQRVPGSLEPVWMARLDGALGDLEREMLGIRAEGGDAVQSIEAQSLPPPEEIPMQEAPPRAAPSPESPAMPPPQSSNPD